MWTVCVAWSFQSVLVSALYNHPGDKQVACKDDVITVGFCCGMLDHCLVLVGCVLHVARCV